MHRSVEAIHVAVDDTPYFRHLPILPLLTLFCRKLWKNRRTLSRSVPPSEESNSGLSPRSFEGLLSWLGPDPQTAGAQYESLRRRLLRLYEWRGADLAEELADETLDRVAKRLEEGEEVRTPDPYRYVAGVARRVFQELVRRESRHRKALAKDPWPLPPPQTAEEKRDQERRLLCLSQALQHFPAESQRLLLSYYQGEGAAKISNRRSLAQEIGIPINALRIRMHRMRQRLATAVEACLSRFPRTD